MYELNCGLRRFSLSTQHQCRRRKSSRSQSLVSVASLIVTLLALLLMAYPARGDPSQSAKSAEQYHKSYSWDEYHEIENVVDVTLPSGFRYKGEVNPDNEPHGSGVRGNAKGEPVEGGEWRFGKLNGQGFQKRDDGSLYSGEFRDDFRHGKGTLTDDKGNRFSGGWHQGTMNGVMTCVYKTGEIFEGEYAFGIQEGLGMQWDAKGELVQAGRWHEGVFKERSAIPRAFIQEGEHLKAEVKDVEYLNWDGTAARYEGQRNENNFPHGKGTMYNSANEAIQGDSWVNGRQDGKGYLRMRNKYEGEFQHGRFHGKGFYTLFTGTTYEGDWVRDDMEGLGRLIIGKSGEISEGEFSNSQQEGFAVRWSKDGEILNVGVFHDGLFSSARPVPMNKLPFKTFIPKDDKVQACDLVYPIHSGRYYKGEFTKDFLAHGRGDMYNNSGVIVSGPTWKDGQQAGDGFFTLGNGYKYTGEIIDGEAHGRGKIEDATGFLLYEGEWKRSEMEGRGTSYDKIGIVYTGDFLNGQKHGRGKQTRSDGIYEGQWQFELMHGFGVLWSKTEGIVRVGRWILGEFKHEAVIPRSALLEAEFLSLDARMAEFIAVDGSAAKYEGERNKDNQPFGAGDMLNAKTGVKLAGGEWENGLLEGIGYATWSDDSKYVGGFHEGMMHGDGTLDWPDGDKYFGGFAADQRKGTGSLIYGDGSKYEGQWDNDMMDGNGVITWSDGAIYEGQLVKNEKEGYGVVWNKVGVRMTCGLFAGGKLVETRSVPSKVIQVGTHLSTAERSSNLLYPDRSYYVGALNADFEPHGFGIMYDANDAVTRAGHWKNGKEAAEGDSGDASSSADSASSSQNTTTAASANAEKKA